MILRRFRGSDFPVGFGQQDFKILPHQRILFQRQPFLQFDAGHGDIPAEALGLFRRRGGDLLVQTRHTFGPGIFRRITRQDRDEELGILVTLLDPGGRLSPDGQSDEHKRQKPKAHI